MWNISDTVVGTNIPQHRKSAPIPTTAQQIRFRFYSDDSNVPKPTWGVFIDNVEVRAKLPDDANSGIDAGNDFDHALNLPISTSTTNYAGYLNNDQDWYSFYISPSDISESKRISVQLAFSSKVSFRVALYAPNNPNSPKAGPSLGFIDYWFSPSDTSGQWKIKIYPEIGFGQYDFYLGLLSSTGGGGCPTLLVWNGTVYKDFGVINIHAPEDVVKEVSLSPEDVDVQNFKARFRLREGWEGLSYSHSEIDQVKLYAVVNGTRYLCPLVYAKYSESGSVLLRLLFSDDWKVNIYLLETIDLRFIVPYQNIEEFIFIIEGRNIWKDIY